MTQDKFFEYLEILECWYKLNIVNLTEYMKLKSNIVDVFREKVPDNDEDLPF